MPNDQTDRRPPTGTIKETPPDRLAILTDQLAQLAAELEALKRRPPPADPAEHLDRLAERLTAAETRLDDPAGLVADLVPHWPAARLEFYRDANNDGAYTTADGRRVQIPTRPYSGSAEVITQSRRPGEAFQIGVKNLDARPAK